MKKGNLWAATGGHLLDEVRAEAAVERAVHRREASEAKRRAQAGETVYGATAMAGLPRATIRTAHEALRSGAAAAMLRADRATDGGCRATPSLCRHG